MPKKKKTPKRPVKLQVLAKKPETVEDLVVTALDKGGLKEVVQILRDWHGFKDRDPTAYIKEVHRKLSPP
jgi:hypothetical protein